MGLRQGPFRLAERCQPRSGWPSRLHRAFAIGDRNSGMFDVGSPCVRQYHLVSIALEKRGFSFPLRALNAPAQSGLRPDDDECLWTGDVVIEAGSEWEGRGDGAQAVESERLNLDFLLGDIGSRSAFGDSQKLLI